MTNAFLNRLRKISRSLRSWLRSQIESILLPIVSKQVQFELEKFELSDTASAEVKSRLVLVDHDDMASYVDLELFKRDIMDADGVDDKLTEKLETYVESDNFDEFAESIKDNMAELQDKITDLQAFDLDELADDVNRLNSEVDDLCTDYFDLDKRISRIEGAKNLDQEIKRQINIAIERALRGYCDLISDSIHREYLGGSDK